MNNILHKLWYSDFVCWIRHRTWDKYHIVKTDLEPGYYDKDEIMLHANFSLLVDYVENELAYQMMYSEYDKIPSHNKWFSEYFNCSFRSRELGLAALDWGINLEPFYLEDVDMHESQRTTSQEIKELYLWWKDVRPNRKDPYSDLKTVEDAKALCSECVMSRFEIEELYHKEDEEMLIRLMKIRRCLWT